MQEFKNHTIILFLKMKSMKFIVITEIGTEDSTVKELAQFFKIKANKHQGYVSFNLSLIKKNLEILCRFLILTQSSKKVLAFISEVEFNSNEDLLNKLKKKLPNDSGNYWFDSKKTFHVRCIHYHSNLSSRDIEPEIGELLLDKYSDLSVSMADSDLKVITFINQNKAILGIDLSFDDLSKRQYKLINSGKSINATVAYHLIREIDYVADDNLLDPNTKTAEIAIESALYVTGMRNYYESLFKFENLKLFTNIDVSSVLKDIKESAQKQLKSKKKNKKIHAYSELLKDVTAGKSNAKVAGVLDLIEFSKVGLDWIDARFDKGEVDKVATILPSESKNLSKKIAKNIYDELMYQLDYVLKPSGLIGILINKSEQFLDLLDRKKFKLVKENKIEIGEQVISCLVLRKI
jgi:23S rRNA G2445 N2-methylase RlmL